MAGGYNESNIASSYVALLSQANPYNGLREHVAECALILAGVGSLEGITVADAGCGDGRW
jgi:hypothetical protein